MQVIATCSRLISPTTWSWTPQLIIGEDQPELPLVPEPADPSPPLDNGAVEAHIASHRLTHWIIEAIQGARNPLQLAHVCDDPALSCLMSRLTELRSMNVSLGSVRAQTLGDKSAEVSIRLTSDSRDIAMAMRVDRVADQWRCTALLIG